MSRNLALSMAAAALFGWALAGHLMERQDARVRAIVRQECPR